MQRMTLPALLSAAASVALLVAAPAHACQPAVAQAAACAAVLCGSEQTHTANPHTTTDPGAPLDSAVGGLSVDVNIGDFAFTPPLITIPTGTQVHWTHLGLFPHTVTSIAMPPVFDSGTMGSGDEYSRTFGAVGEFDYECKFHFGMDGRVTVRLGGDANGDNAVNIADFSILGTNFNQGNATYDDGDFNLNQTVEIGDFAILAANFNTSAGAVGSRGSAVPEPTLGAMALSLAVIGARRKR